MHGSTKMSGGGDQMPTYWIKYVNLINPNCSVDNGCPWPVGGGGQKVWPVWVAKRAKYTPKKHKQPCTVFNFSARPVALFTRFSVILSVFGVVIEESAVTLSPLCHALNY